MFTVLKRSPKLLPLWAVSKLYLTLGLQVQVSKLSGLIPRGFYDVRNVDGIRFGVRLSRPEDYMTVFGSHEKSFLAVKPGPGDFVLDIGAHIGSYALRYSRLVGQNGRVLAFEPEPENRRILVWNTRLNNARNVIVRSEALGDYTGTSTMKVSKGTTGHSLAPRFPLPVDLFHEVGAIKVRVSRIDDLDLSRVDVVKIDVEGYELNVLRGGEKTLLSLRPRLQIEIHSAHHEHCGVCGWLGEKGFSTRILEQRGGSHWIEAW